MCRGFVRCDLPARRKSVAPDVIDLPRNLASEPPGAAVPRSRTGWFLLLAAVGMAAAVVAGWWLIRCHSVAASGQNSYSASNIRLAIAVIPGANVRIRCGYTKGEYIDPSGALAERRVLPGGAQVSNGPVNSFRGPTILLCIKPPAWGSFPTGFRYGRGHMSFGCTLLSRTSARGYRPRAASSPGCLMSP